GKVNAVLEKAKAEGLAADGDAATATTEDWTSFGVPKIQARKLVEQFKPAPEPAKPAVALPQFTAGTALPQVPDDESFLKALLEGGVLKPQAMDVVAAIRIKLADQIGVYDIEDTIMEAIEKHSGETDEPCPEVFYDLENRKASKEHAALLKALGASGRFATQRRRKELLAKLDSVWDILKDFQGQLNSWQQSWMEQASGPAALTTMMTAMMGGGPALAAAGLNQVPDTSPVIDAATGVINKLNKVFSGTGIPVARALAAEAVELRRLLEKPELPVAVGAASRDEMVKKLGLGVTADMVRTEKSLSQYTLAVLNVPTTPTDQLPMYITALKQVGATIPWDALRAGKGNGVPGRKPRRTDDEDGSSPRSRTF
ncbi:MAG: hypothetical protein AAB692_01580, partial [Patescibacteria group bacterium]